ncbi:MAG: esterase [Tannerellaceae bacterium]|jgi:enterochelin esterase family protein|nr:esterase [Tannerellaceae bacterium]
MKKYLFLSVFALIAVMLSGQELQNFRPQQLVSPEIANGKVTFRIAAPQAYQVRLYGSWMASYTASEPLARDTAGVWSITINAPAPEIYTYNFIVDGVSKSDDLNIFMQRDGRRFLSILLIDGPLTANYREANKRGNLEHVWYNSPTIGTTRRMFVYTPHGYADSKQKYPVLYLLHGGGGDEDAWSNMGRACQILDNLIEQGKSVPMIVVMPNGNPGQQAAQTQLLPERAFNRNDPAFANLYIHSLVKDIVPYIESHYRVIANANNRAISGLSMGGGHTLAATNNYPGFFSWILPLSMGIGEGVDNDAAFQAVKKAGYKLYWVACGTDDFVWDSAKRLDAALTKNGLEHTFYITDGGHTWANWRKYLNTFAPLLFR